MDTGMLPATIESLYYGPLLGAHVVPCYALHIHISVDTAEEVDSLTFETEE
jgi:hypothetical protein